MNLVSQSFYELDVPNKLKLIERIGRICYKSEDKITDTSYEQFVTQMINSGHTAMLEHCTLHFETDYLFVEALKWYSPFAHNITYSSKDVVRMSLNATAFRELVDIVLSRNHALATDAQTAVLAMLAEAYKVYPVLFIDLWNANVVAIQDAVETVETYGSYINLLKEFSIDTLKTAHDILTHVYKTFVFITDRGVTHELVRHRIPSYAQESTRYVNYSKQDEITVIDPMYGIANDVKTRALSVHLLNEIEATWRKAMLDAEEAYMKLIHLGATPQIARSVLPNSTKTEIAVTTNLYEWFHIFFLRTASTAHPQMQEAMFPVAQQVVPQYKSLLTNLHSVPNSKLRNEVSTVLAQF